MPVILEPEHWQPWLEAGTPDATKLLVPSGDDKLDIYPVSTKVNNPQYIRSDCIEQVEGEGCRCAQVGSTLPLPASGFSDVPDSLLL